MKLTHFSAKPLKISSTVLMVVPVVFFVIFLHPLYLVQLFERHAFTLIVFRILAFLVVCAGFVGLAWYMLELLKAIATKQFAQPSLWFKLSLSLATGSLLFKFLMPITFNL